MDLSKMMRASGIGCGDGCYCMHAFISSLDDQQKSMFGHMIQRGAEVRLEAIQGKRESGRASLEESLEAVFGNDGENRPSALDMILRLLTRMPEELDEIEPYDGPLGVEIELILADEVPEDERPHVEHRLRQIIAAKADNNPTRIELMVASFGLAVRLREDGESSDNAGPTESAAVS